MIEIIPNWHPLFVHFTVALFSLSILFFLIQRPLAETEIGDNFLLFARYSLWLGAVFSIATLIAGFDAYNTVNHDTPSHNAMTEHKNWALATLAVFFIAAIWWAIVNRVSEKASVAFLVLLLVGGGLLVATGHRGSQLVYQYGLGVESLPAKGGHAAGAGHDHDHGAEASADGHHDGNAESGAAHSHGTSEKADDGHAHDHSSMEKDQGSMDIDMDMREETMPIPDDMKMDTQMMEPDVSLLEKTEGNIVKTEAVEPEPAKPQPQLQAETTQKAKQKPIAQTVAGDDDVVDVIIDDDNTFLIPAAQSNRIPVPEAKETKIEKYDDGTIRETLPAVSMELQE